MSPSGRPACALLSPSGRPVCVPEADTTEPASCRPVCALAGSSRRSADESFGTPGLYRKQTPLGLPRAAQSVLWSAPQGG